MSAPDEYVKNVLLYSDTYLKKLKKDQDLLKRTDELMSSLSFTTGTNSAKIIHRSSDPFKYEIWYIKNTE